MWRAQRGGAAYVRRMSDREREGEQGKKMQLNGHTAFLSSVKKQTTKRSMLRSVLILWRTTTNKSTCGKHCLP